MTPEQRADAAETAAIRRYLAMRQVWCPCWGAVARDAGPQQRR